MHHRPKEPSLMGSCRRLKEEQTPVSTGAQLPSQQSIKPFWIGKLVNKYLKQMEEEQRNFRRSRPRNRQKSTLRPVDSTRKIPAKNASNKLKANNTQEGKRTRQKGKLKVQRSVLHVPSSKKKLSASHSTRRRYQTNESEKMGRSLSGNLRGFHRSTSNSATKHHSDSKPLRTCKTPKSEDSRQRKPRTCKFKEENPFSIYFKSAQHEHRYG